MKTLCLYAIVRFMPYAETQEFANVGVVMCVPDKSIFKFKLAPTRFGRVTQFFEDLDGGIYKTALQLYENELLRIQKYVESNGSTLTAQVFRELTRHREGVIYFGNIRTALINNPDTKLEELFEHYVKRAFANNEYKEKVLEKHVRAMFRTEQITGFKKQKLPTSLGGFEVPFAKKDEHRIRVIKPLAFEQKTPLLAFEHTRTWAERLQRFVGEAQQAPDDVLFAIEKPLHKNFITAYDEALDLIQQNGMMATTKDSEILEFGKLN